MNAMLSRLHTQPCTIAAGRRPRPVYGIIRYPVKYSVVRHLPSGRTVVAKAAASDRPTGSEAAILKLTDSLRLLETERDEAVGTAESSARSAVKLEEMTRLLERLAMDKVAEGDDAGARQVLQEKAAVAEVLSRTSSRAQTNFALAAKLAEKIGQHQADLMDLLAGGSSSSSSSTSSGSGSGKPAASSAAAAAPPPAAAAAAAAAAAPQPPPASPRPASSSSSSTSSYSGYSSSSSAGSSSSYSSGGGYEAPWEKSLEQARQRIKQAEAEAAAAGSAAAWKGRESLEEARERLRRDALSSVASARSRIQASASESIEAARARIAAEDAAVLAQVHALIDRYKAGQYVSEDDLDWAFRQLEQRAWRS
ncbi:hypothetical protein OEZ85_003192 [Tetradesmus obliquus]|uniref:UVR domain-containing protein n=1 Tax=Tetradesmus obliquus TaxID=3088 RepID=A0ABY8U014_TETOB|nr:hypothetical protein OEZ85_003192 [Tetradesmus obliquus]